MKEADHQLLLSYKCFQNIFPTIIANDASESRYERSRSRVVVRVQISPPLATSSLVPNPYLPSVCWAFCFFRIKLADYPWNICPKGRIEHEKHISQHGDGVEQRMLPVLLSFSIISSNHCSTFQKALRSTLSCVFCDSWLRQTLQMHPRRGVRPASEASSFN